MRLLQVRVEIHDQPSEGLLDSDSSSTASAPTSGTPASAASTASAVATLEVPGFHFKCLSPIKVRFRFPVKQHA